ncbi:MAG: hypothetical protein ACRDY3_05745 [Acidimicrobiales bacterium]
MAVEAAAPQAGAGPQPGAWQGRPPGIPGSVPPPSVPLSFLAVAALGLVACGAALAWSGVTGVTDPSSARVIAAAHLAVLATLSMGVMGAMHQFTPVITQRPLRSITLARWTLASWFVASWLLPIGVAIRQETIVIVGGGCAALAIALLVANLSSPLAARGRGAPVTGLRLALAGFVVTGTFGVVYVADRSGAWFDLAGHILLAHAVVGVFAWLGLAYIAVAEKLWPMFFLAHVPGKHRAGWVAVCTVPAGVALLSPGLLFGVLPLACAGAAIAGVGIAAHLVSLGVHVRHRRRKADLHLLFILVSAAWLGVGGGLALAGVLVMGSRYHTGVMLVTAAVAALAGWILETIVGHVHKVVPFIMWSVLRSRGVAKNPAGKPLMFADLYNHALAGVAFGLVTAGVAGVCIGFAASLAWALAAGGVLLGLTGLVVAVNLSYAPHRMLATAASRPPVEVPAAA